MMKDEAVGPSQTAIRSPLSDSAIGRIPKTADDSNLESALVDFGSSVFATTDRLTMGFFRGSSTGAIWGLIWGCCSTKLAKNTVPSAWISSWILIYAVSGGLFVPSTRFIHENFAISHSASSVLSAATLGSCYGALKPTLWAGVTASTKQRLRLASRGGLFYGSVALLAECAVSKSSSIVRRVWLKEASEEDMQQQKHGSSSLSWTTSWIPITRIDPETYEQTIGEQLSQVRMQMDTVQQQVALIDTQLARVRAEKSQKVTN